MAAAFQDPAAVLERNKRNAARAAQIAGTARVRKILKRAQVDLNKRLRQADLLRGDGEETFTTAQMRVTLEQVKHVLRTLGGGMREQILGQGKKAAEQSVTDTISYLNAAERKYRGVATQSLAIDEAAMQDRIVANTESSLLNRIASDPNHKGQAGVLERYGDNVIGRFEEELQLRLIARKPWDDVRQGLIEASPFLQEAPAYWAERIIRTETMYAHNRAGFESIRAANAELGDVVKILSATFDSRTGADSYAVHGQIRKPDEAFDGWFGSYMHPPNRPNDREIVVMHRIAWPLPTYLAPRSNGEVLAAWAREGRKGAPPGRPLMSTVDRFLFGKGPEEPSVTVSGGITTEGAALVVEPM